MARRVLVPMDESPPSQAAFEHALSAFPTAQLVALHVIKPPEVAAYGEILAPPVDDGPALERASRMLRAAERRGADAGVDVSTATERGTPARTIVDFAEVHDIDHIIIGSHGRAGVRRLLFGSVAEQVARRAGVPVTVVHDSPEADQPVTGH